MIIKKYQIGSITLQTTYKTIILTYIIRRVNMPMIQRTIKTMTKTINYIKSNYDYLYSYIDENNKEGYIYNIGREQYFIDNNNTNIIRILES